MTNENTDAQFSVGGDGYYSFALWVPPAVGGEWIAAGHYVAPTDYNFGKVTLMGQLRTQDREQPRQGQEPQPRPTENAGSSVKSAQMLLILGVLIPFL